MSVRKFPDVSSQQILVGIISVRRSGVFCIKSALPTPCIPVSMLALGSKAEGMMKLHLEDGMSERTNYRHTYRQTWWKYWLAVKGTHLYKSMTRHVIVLPSAYIETQRHGVNNI